MTLNRQFADAIVAALNNPPDSFSQSFTATRAKTPIFDLKDLATLRVTVVSRGKTRARTLRGDDWSHNIPVELIIQKKFEYTGDTQRSNLDRMNDLAALVDPLEDFCEELVDYLRNLVIEQRRPIEIEQVLYDEEDLLDHQFFSMIRLGYSTTT